jgi:1-deoxy-D-xylulose-5-phosphate synthase
LPVGRAQVCREGREVAILAFGPLLAEAMQAGQTLGATVVNMRWVKPLDTELLAEIAASHRLLVTVEDHVIQGGAGSAVAEALHAMGASNPLLQLGHPDRWVEHGEQGDLLASLGLDAAGIARSVVARMPALAVSA